MQSEKRDFNRKLKRAGIFIACYFVFAVIISTLLVLYTSVPQWLNGLIIIVGASVFYLIFLVICDKIDKKKDERKKAALGKKAPFSD